MLNNNVVDRALSVSLCLQRQSIPGTRTTLGMCRAGTNSDLSFGFLCFCGTNLEFMEQN